MVFQVLFNFHKMEIMERAFTAEVVLMVNYLNLKNITPVTSDP